MRNTTQSGQVPIVKIAPSGSDRGIATGAEPFQISAMFCEDERDADRRDQRHEARGAPKRPVRDPLDRRVEQGAADHGQQERHEDRRNEGAERRVLLQAEHAQRDRRRDHPADHEHVAVGEVDQLEDAVDERVAERDERVERAVRQPDQEDPEELVPVLRQVDAQPDDDERDEGEPDRRDDDARKTDLRRLNVTACA